MDNEFRQQIPVSNVAQIRADDSSAALLLVFLSIMGVAVGYSASIVIARLLGPDAFQDYVVAVAELGLFCAIAEFGVGKLSLKTMPGYVASGEWALASGYWRFSLATTGLASLLLMGCVLIWESQYNAMPWDDPLGIAILFLPAAAVCGIGIDLVMANRAAFTGMLIARVLLPATTLAIIVAVNHWAADFTVSVAIVCYGAGSVAGAIYCLVAFVWSAQPKVLLTRPQQRKSEWLPQCMYFALYSFLASWTIKISLVVLNQLPVSEIQVAHFAAALETGCLILLLAKSTDKFFEPQMSIVIATRDFESGFRLRDSRYRLVWSGCGLFLLVMLLFGKQILSIYGDGYADGHHALCLISVGTCLLTMFSLAPAYLRFVDRARFVNAVMIVAAVSMAVLTAAMGYFFGATGAAAAFCIVSATVSLTYLQAANRHIKAQQENGDHQLVD